MPIAGGTNLSYLRLQTTEKSVPRAGSTNNIPSDRRLPRPAGRYASALKIPGNLLSEGMLFVEPALLTLNPLRTQFRAQSAVAFRVIDSHKGESARADWMGRMNAVMRPLLDWNTRFSPDGHNPAALGGEPKP